MFLSAWGPCRSRTARRQPPPADHRRCAHPPPPWSGPLSSRRRWSTCAGAAPAASRVPWPSCNDAAAAARMNLRRNELRTAQKTAMHASERFANLCVFCGASSGSRPEYTVAAKALADELVRRTVPFSNPSTSACRSLRVGLVRQCVYMGRRRGSGPRISTTGVKARFRGWG